MGVRFPSVQSNVFVGPLPANATETVVCTTPPFTPPQDFSVIFISWFFAFLAGTGVTSVFFNLRRGTTTGGAALRLNPWGLAQTASANGFFSGNYFDSPGAVAGLQYSLTIIQTGATAGGTQVDTAMLAFAL